MRFGGIMVHVYIYISNQNVKQAFIPVVSIIYVSYTTADIILAGVPEEDV